MFDVQAFLARRNSGLAHAYTGSTTAARMVSDAANRWGIKPQWILLVLQAEQDLVTDPTVRSAAITVHNLTDPHADIKPAPRYGGTVVRNGGTGKRPSDGGPATPDGNWWIEFEGDKKMAFAGGAGIPDEHLFPYWDVRDYVGFKNQVEWIARLAARDLGTYARVAAKDPAARTAADLDRISVTLYGGERVVAANAETFVMLQWTPNPSVLVDRPKIYKEFFA